MWKHEVKTQLVSQDSVFRKYVIYVMNTSPILTFISLLMYLFIYHLVQEKYLH